MPVYNQSEQQMLSSLVLGIKVERASDTLAQTGTQTLFNIVGGMVGMIAISGEVTVILGAVGNLSLEATPTDGTMGVLCAVVAAGTFEAGTVFSITGAIATAMTGIDAGGCACQLYPVALQIGTIQERLSASSTGEIQWTMWYVPLEDGAYVTAG